MKKIITMAIIAVSLTAHAMGSDYERGPNGGWIYKGNCTRNFIPGVAKLDYVMDCMKIYGSFHKTPEKITRIETRNGTYITAYFGGDIFYFKNGVLEVISRGN